MRATVLASTHEFRERSPQLAESSKNSDNKGSSDEGKREIAKTSNPAEDAADSASSDGFYAICSNGDSCHTAEFFTPVPSFDNITMRNNSMAVSCGASAHSKQQSSPQENSRAAAAAMAHHQQPQQQILVSQYDKEERLLSSSWPEQFTTPSSHSRESILATPASSSPAEKAANLATAAASLAWDPADTKRYEAEVSAVLHGFDRAKEWADLNNCLQKLLKVFSAPTSSSLGVTAVGSGSAAAAAAAFFPFIPHKAVVAKRLAQCLNPLLPSGVHKRALETYSAIFERIGPDGLSQDLAIYSGGLFPFFQDGASHVKPIFLNLINAYYLPLGRRLIPCLSGLLVSLLPGLDDEKTPSYPYVVATLWRLCACVGEKRFVAALWLALLRASRVRLAALSLLDQLMTPSLPALLLEDKRRVRMLLPDRKQLVVGAMEATFSDESPFVRRQLLDILIKNFPFDQKLLLSRNEKVRLLRAGLRVLPLRDWSLTRRFLQWVTNKADDVILDNQDGASNLSFFIRYVKDPLVEAICLELDEIPSTKKEANAPLKSLAILIVDNEDLEAFAAEAMPLLTVPLLRYLLRESSNAIWGSSVLQEAKQLFHVKLAQPRLVWEALTVEMHAALCFSTTMMIPHTTTNARAEPPMIPYGEIGVSSTSQQISSPITNTTTTNTGVLDQRTSATTTMWVDSKTRSLARSVAVLEPAVTKNTTNLTVTTSNPITSTLTAAIDSPGTSRLPSTGVKTLSKSSSDIGATGITEECPTTHTTTSITTNTNTTTSSSTAGVCPANNGSHVDTINSYKDSRTASCVAAKDESAHVRDGYAAISSSNNRNFDLLSGDVVATKNIEFSCIRSVSTATNDRSENGPTSSSIRSRISSGSKGGLTSGGTANMSEESSRTANADNERKLFRTIGAPNKASVSGTLFSPTHLEEEMGLQQSRRVEAAQRCIEVLLLAEIYIDRVRAVGEEQSGAVVADNGSEENQLKNCTHSGSSSGNAGNPTGSYLAGSFHTRSSDISSSWTSTGKTGNTNHSSSGIHLGSSWGVSGTTAGVRETKEECFGGPANSLDIAVSAYQAKAAKPIGEDLGTAGLPGLCGLLDLLSDVLGGLHILAPTHEALPTIQGLLEKVREAFLRIRKALLCLRLYDQQRRQNEGHSRQQEEERVDEEEEQEKEAARELLDCAILKFFSSVRQFFVFSENLWQNLRMHAPMVESSALSTLDLLSDLQVLLYGLEEALQEHEQQRLLLREQAVEQVENEKEEKKAERHQQQEEQQEKQLLESSFWVNTACGWESTAAATGTHQLAQYNTEKTQTAGSRCFCGEKELLKQEREEQKCLFSGDGKMVEETSQQQQQSNNKSSSSSRPVVWCAVVGEAADGVMEEGKANQVNFVEPTAPPAATTGAASGGFPLLFGASCSSSGGGGSLLLPSWLCALLNCCQVQQLPICCRAVRTFLNFLQCFSSSRRRFLILETTHCDRVALRLWEALGVDEAKVESSVGDTNYSNRNRLYYGAPTAVAGLILQLDETCQPERADVMHAVITSALIAATAAAKASAIARFSLLWRCCHLQPHATKRPLFPSGSLLVIKALGDTDPSIQYAARAFVRQALHHLPHILNPIFEQLLVQVHATSSLPVEAATAAGSDACIERSGKPENLVSTARVLLEYLQVLSLLLQYDGPSLVEAMQHYYVSPTLLLTNARIHCQLFSKPVPIATAPTTLTKAPTSNTTTISSAPEALLTATDASLTATVLDPSLIAAAPAHPNYTKKEEEEASASTTAFSKKGSLAGVQSAPPVPQFSRGSYDELAAVDYIDFLCIVTLRLIRLQEQPASCTHTCKTSNNRNRSSSSCSPTTAPTLDSSTTSTNSANSEPAAAPIFESASSSLFAALPFSSAETGATASSTATCASDAFAAVRGAAAELLRLFVAALHPTTSRAKEVSCLIAEPLIAALDLAVTNGDKAMQSQLLRLLHLVVLQSNASGPSISPASRYLLEHSVQQLQHKLMQQQHQQQLGHFSRFSSRLRNSKDDLLPARGEGKIFSDACTLFTVAVESKKAKLPHLQPIVLRTAALVPVLLRSMDLWESRSWHNDQQRQNHLNSGLNSGNSLGQADPVRSAESGPEQLAWLRGCPDLAGESVEEAADLCISLLKCLDSGSLCEVSYTLIHFFASQLSLAVSGTPPVSRTFWQSRRGVSTHCCPISTTTTTKAQAAAPLLRQPPPQPNFSLSVGSGDGSSGHSFSTRLLGVVATAAEFASENSINSCSNSCHTVVTSHTRNAEGMAMDSAVSGGGASSSQSTTSTEGVGMGGSAAATSGPVFSSQQQQLFFKAPHPSPGSPRCPPAFTPSHPEASGFCFAAALPFLNALNEVLEFLLDKAHTSNERAVDAAASRTAGGFFDLFSWGNSGNAAGSVTEMNEKQLPQVVALLPSLVFAGVTAVAATLQLHRLRSQQQQQQQQLLLQQQQQQQEERYCDNGLSILRHSSSSSIRRPARRHSASFFSCCSGGRGSSGNSVACNFFSDSTAIDGVAGGASAGIVALVGADLDARRNEEAVRGKVTNMMEMLLQAFPEPFVSSCLAVWTLGLSGDGEKLVALLFILKQMQPSTTLKTLLPPLISLYKTTLHGGSASIVSQCCSSHSSTVGNDPAAAAEAADASTLLDSCRKKGFRLLYVSPALSAAAPAASPLSSSSTCTAASTGGLASYCKTTPKSSAKAGQKGAASRNKEKEILSGGQGSCLTSAAALPLLLLPFTELSRARQRESVILHFLYCLLISAYPPPYVQRSLSILPDQCCTALQQQPTPSSPLKFLSPQKNSTNTEQTHASNNSASQGQNNEAFGAPTTAAAVEEKKDDISISYSMLVAGSEPTQTGLLAEPALGFLWSEREAVISMKEEQLQLQSQAAEEVWSLLLKLLSVVIAQPKQPVSVLWVGSLLLTLDRVKPAREATITASKRTRRELQDLAHLWSYIAARQFSDRIASAASSNAYDVLSPLPPVVDVINQALALPTLPISNNSATAEAKSFRSSGSSSSGSDGNSVEEPFRYNLGREIGGCGCRYFGAESAGDASYYSGGDGGDGGLGRGEWDLQGKGFGCTNSSSCSSGEEQQQQLHQHLIQQLLQRLHANGGRPSLGCLPCLHLINRELLNRKRKTPIVAAMSASVPTDAAEVAAHYALAFLIMFCVEATELNRRSALTSIFLQTLSEDIPLYLLPALHNQSPQSFTYRYLSLCVLRYFPIRLYPAATHILRKAVVEVMPAAAFFTTDRRTCICWQKIIRCVLSSDTQKIDFLLPPPHAGVFASRDSDILHRLRYLKRLSFLLFCSRKDSLQPQLPFILEKLTEALKLNSNNQTPALTEQVFLCIRVLLLRLSSSALTPVWPILLTELIKVFSAAAPAEPAVLATTKNIACNNSPTTTTTTMTGSRRKSSSSSSQSVMSISTLTPPPLITEKKNLSSSFLTSKQSQQAAVMQLSASSSSGVCTAECERTASSPSKLFFAAGSPKKTSLPSTSLNNTEAFPCGAAAGPANFCTAVVVKTSSSLAAGASPPSSSASVLTTSLELQPGIQTPPPLSSPPPPSFSTTTSLTRKKAGESGKTEKGGGEVEKKVSLKNTAVNTTTVPLCASSLLISPLLTSPFAHNQVSSSFSSNTTGKNTSSTTTTSSNNTIPTTSTTTSIPPTPTTNTTTATAQQLVSGTSSSPPLSLLLAALKVVDLAALLDLPDFHLYQWMFIQENLLLPTIHHKNRSAAPNNNERRSSAWQQSSSLNSSSTSSGFQSSQRSLTSSRSSRSPTTSNSSSSPTNNNSSRRSSNTSLFVGSRGSSRSREGSFRTSRNSRNRRNSNSNSSSRSAGDRIRGGRCVELMMSGGQSSKNQFEKEDRSSRSSLLGEDEDEEEEEEGGEYSKSVQRVSVESDSFVARLRTVSLSEQVADLGGRQKKRQHHHKETASENGVAFSAGVEVAPAAESRLKKKDGCVVVGDVHAGGAGASFFSETPPVFAVAAAREKEAQNILHKNAAAEKPSVTSKAAATESFSASSSFSSEAAAGVFLAATRRGGVPVDLESAEVSSSRNSSLNEAALLQLQHLEPVDSAGIPSAEGVPFIPYGAMLALWGSKRAALAAPTPSELYNQSQQSSAQGASYQHSSSVLKGSGSLIQTKNTEQSRESSDNNNNNSCSSSRSGEGVAANDWMRTVGPGSAAPPSAHSKDLSHRKHSFTPASAAAGVDGSLTASAPRGRSDRRNTKSNFCKGKSKCTFTATIKVAAAARGAPAARGRAFMGPQVTVRNVHTVEDLARVAQRLNEASMAGALRGAKPDELLITRSVEQDFLESCDLIIDLWPDLQCVALHEHLWELYSCGFDLLLPADAVQ